jgi:hypothetical protein
LTAFGLSGMLGCMNMRNTEGRHGAGGGSRLPLRVLVSAGALMVSLLVAEVVLRVLDLPRFSAGHEETRRFMLTDERVDGMPVYLNYPGRITFTYADNPRGYFDSRNALHHEVNAAGFRGREFGVKSPSTSRIAFLGDSFTFGEGVRLEHTYPEVTARALRGEACNLGVGGYNTTQAVKLLKLIGLGLAPDAVVLGYVPNDAEPPLFDLDPATGQPVRRNREADIEAEGSPQRPPATTLCRLRVAQLVWRAWNGARLTRQTEAHYLSLYADGSEGWRESERALRELMGLCRENGIPCVVVMFPILHALSDRHPFAGIHHQVCAVVRAEGGHFVDLLPALKGTRASEFWVHATDQHPNERVHAIAGELVAEALRAVLGSSRQQSKAADRDRVETVPREPR